MSQTVLVADDSETIRKVVKLALKVAPFEVVSVGSGEETLQHADGNTALIVLDYHFPNASGYQIAQQLKQQPATADVPIIMLAGNYHGFDEQKARSAGVDTIIPKPFDTDTLLDAIVAATSVSKKALVKRQKGAPKTQSPMSGDVGAPSAKAPGASGSGKPTGRIRGKEPARGGDSGGNQPRMRTPGDDSSSDRQGSGGARRRQPSASQSGGGLNESSNPRRRGSGGSPAQSNNPQQSSPPQSGGDSGGVELDIDLDDEEESPEPAAQGSGSSPRFQSPSGSEEPAQAGNAGGARRRPVTTPESQAGSKPDNPRSGGSGNARMPSSGGQSGSGQKPDGGSGGGTPGGVNLDEDELNERIETYVKEVVRDELPKILRKVMGEVFQDRVLPKLVEHGRQQVESLIGDQLDERIHEEVRVQLDQLLEEL